MASKYVETSWPVSEVAVVTLSRPARLNALTKRLVLDLTAAFKALADDTRCRVVILTGAGRAFCAGLDLTGYDDKEPAPSRHPLDLLARQREIVAVMEQIHRLRQPVIAAVNGPAAGGGLALACVSDIRLASTDAIFAASFIRAGFSGCDMGISWLLPRIVGAGAAHDMMLTGRRVDATEAARIGLATSVVEAPALLDAALAKAHEILQNPPSSVELTKEGMWLNLEQPSLAGAIELENRQQVIAALTDDAQEATQAFLGKRAPHYEGR